MSRRNPCLWVLAAALVLCAMTPAHAQTTSTAAVVHVVIESFWGGLNPDAPFQTRLVIEQTADGYRWSGTESKGMGDRKKEQVYPEVSLPASAVSRLKDAMTAAPRPRVDLQALQPAIANIQAQVDRAFAEASDEGVYSKLEPARLQALRDELRHPDVLADVLTQGLSDRHTDDYPHVRIDMTLADGTTLTAGSDSQQYLMLPWRTGTGALTYAVDLPMAVAALLPAGATNRERLEETMGGAALETLLGMGLAPRLEHLQVESQAPDALHALQAQLDVTEISIVSFEGPHVDAVMHLTGGPSNLQIDARLALDGTRLKDEGSAIRLRQMLELVASTPALQARILRYPQRDFRVRHGYADAWPRARLVQQFVDQMRALGKLAELEAASSSLRDAVMVEEGRSPIYWLVLPDRRAVWWKEFDPSSDAA
ncbi:MAG TPA: hypothetical protein VFG49_05080, partial [Dyella sp.]|uniref:hypothetical protein n=1 Tax=Dyella sp. TaxID=1869338 RepID=UPI002D77E161